MQQEEREEEVASLMRIQEEERGWGLNDSTVGRLTVRRKKSWEDAGREGKKRDGMGWDGMCGLWFSFIPNSKEREKEFHE